jgi:hypothetical protein
MIDPRLWDDPEFVSLTPFVQKLWFYLLSGPEAYASCPGLLRLDVQSLAGALRASPGDVDAALVQLRALGWIQEDRERRVIRVPNAPRYRRPQHSQVSGRVLWSWFRRWRQVPDCALKTEHIRSVRDSLTQRGLQSNSWAETFGSVSGESTTHAKSARSPEPTSQLSLGLEKSVNLVNRDEFMDPDPDQDPDPDPDLPEPARALARSSPRASDELPTGNGARARTLWEALQRARVEVGLPRVEPTPGPLAVIQRLLQPYGEFLPEQLDHSIRASLLQAKLNPRCEFLLNGIDTWSPNVIARNQGMRVEPRAPKRGPNEVTGAELRREREAIVLPTREEIDEIRQKMPWVTHETAALS